MQCLYRLFPFSVLWHLELRGFHKQHWNKGIFCKDRVSKESFINGIWKLFSKSDWGFGRGRMRSEGEAAAYSAAPSWGSTLPQTLSGTSLPLGLLERQLPSLSTPGRSEVPSFIQNYWIPMLGYIQRKK